MSKRGDERLKRCIECSRLWSKLVEENRLLPVPQKQEKVKKSKPWHIHRGSVHLFIVGPAEFAMVRCSDAYYRGRIGNAIEWKIAKETIKVLNDNLDLTYDYGPHEIKTELEKTKHRTNL
jgi:hypothetical protein